LKVIELTYPVDITKNNLPETVSAIGFFDGIHIGHQKVIQTAVDGAKKRQMESAVITFHPHPSVVLKGATDVQYITPLDVKKEILQQYEVDRLYVIQFNQELSKLSPQDFIDHFIIGLNIKHLVGGFDYTYGHKGKGNMENIKEFDRGLFTHEAVEQVTLHGHKISSTRIRKLLQEGDMQKVSELLGRPYTFKSTVIKGDQRGRELGYPTANLKVDKDVIVPGIGIYAAKVHYKGDTYLGMASIGTNPTFVETKALSVEVNILDFDQKIYGEELEVEWHSYLRGEVKYEGADALIEQLALDEQHTREYFQRQDRN
jgi:riboflavin kinase/FMN adenylyltransferase